METCITEAVARHHARAVELSDDLAAHPEVAKEEFRASGEIVELLRQAGYAVEYPYLGYPTAFRGALENGEGPAVGILVEYDALPGLGHACGHNVHGSMAVLAALALADLRDKFRGTLYVYGTPEEEGEGGKIGLSDKGAFDGLALAVMVHSWSGPNAIADMDALGLRCHTVEFRGQPAHAAYAPWEGHSALAAARKFLDLIDARRECFTPDIRVNGVITDGGRQPNTIPRHAEVEVEFRAASQARLAAVDEIILKCAKGAALALDCDFACREPFPGFADMVRVPALEEAVEALFDQMGRPHVPVPPANGSTDVGNVSYRCPAVQPMLPICETFHPLHTPELRDEVTKPAAHAAIASGAELIAALVLRTFRDEAFRARVYEEFRAARAEKL